MKIIIVSLLAAVMMTLISGCSCACKETTVCPVPATVAQAK